MKRINGFSLVETIIIIAVVAVIGLLGYVAYNQFFSTSKDTNTADTTGEALIESIPEAPEVKTETNLTEAVNTMDSIDLDVAEAQITELEAELNKF